MTSTFLWKNTGLNVSPSHPLCVLCVFHQVLCMHVLTLPLFLAIHSLVLGPLLLYCQYTQKWKTSNKLCNQRQNINIAMKSIPCRRLHNALLNDLRSSCSGVSWEYMPLRLLQFCLLLLKFSTIAIKFAGAPFPLFPKSWCSGTRRVQENPLSSICSFVSIHRASL